ncbi:MAG: flagellar basal-body MS-ring/collar protein FliF [Patulibacter sp.]
MNPQAIFSEMSPRARIGLGVAVAGFLAVTFFLLKLATAPAYSTVMTGIEPTQSDKITQALADRGVAYELQNNGTSLAVQKSQIGEARVALANAGVNAGSGTQAGFELLDNQKLGSSDFQQRVTYQRALEGEIANTIGQIDGVNGAEVQLTLPEDKLFSDESTPATAAVLLSGNSSLDGAQVRGIANLVAGSVEGLSVNKVTITDGAGQMLWPTGDGGGSGSASAKAAAQARYDAAMEASINDMLTRTLGANKARVEVAADLNMDESSKEQLEYAEQGTPLSQKVDNETLKGNGSGGATAGTQTNIDGADAATAGSNSNYQHKTTDTTYGVGKTVTKTKVAPGAVNTMQIALLVDNSVQAPTKTELQDMVAAAAGLDTKRGDKITTTMFKFAPVPSAKSPSPITPTGILGMLKYILAGLAAMVFLFLVSRSLKRREAAELGEPTWLREIEQPRPLAELVASLEAGAGSEHAALGSGTHSGREQLAAVAAQDPERLARQLREWMTESEA